MPINLVTVPIFTSVRREHLAISAQASLNRIFPISEDLIELTVSNWEYGKEFIQRFAVDHKTTILC